MDFEGALRARIVAAATPAGSKVTIEDRPQGVALPAVTIQIITDNRPQHLKGFDDLKPALTQIDCWAANSVGRSALKEAVLAAVVPENTSNGIRFSRALLEVGSHTTERVETMLIYRARLDLTFWWATA